MRPWTFALFLLRLAQYPVVFLAFLGSAWAHIDTLIPSATTAGAPTFTLRIIGSDLLPSERILWNGSVVPKVWISSTEIRATISASLVAAPGTATVTLEGFNSLTFTINPPLSITTPSPLPAAIASVPYTQPLAFVGGTGPFRWSGTPPAGLSLGQGGLISGTPSALGSFTFTVQVNDAVPLTASKSFTLEVRDPNCTFSISPTGASVPGAGGEGALQVTAPDGCTWAAASGVNWVVVSSGSGGIGNGTVGYRVGTNTGALRTGTITVAGRTFTITQEAAQSGCTFSVSPTSLTFEREGGAPFFLTVSSGLGCRWTAISNASWISFIGQGEGFSLISWDASPNPGAPRTGTVDIAGQIVTISQKGTCPPSSYTLSPLERLHDKDASDGSVNVTAPALCAWTATTGAAWISIFLPGPGSGSGSVMYQIAENRGSWRGADILIGGRAVPIYQDSSDACVLRFFFALLARPGDSSQPDLSRTFRDTVLAKTPRGRQYTEKYYRFSGEAIRAILFDPSLLWRTRDILERYQPLLKSIVNGEEATIGEQDLANLDSFLNSFATKASPELAEAIQELRRDLRDPKVHREFGVTLKEGQDARRNQR